jgi:hypothetical protein
VCWKMVLWDGWFEGVEMWEDEVSEYYVHGLVVLVFVLVVIVVDCGFEHKCVVIVRVVVVFVCLIVEHDLGVFFEGVVGSVVGVEMENFVVIVGFGVVDVLGTCDGLVGIVVEGNVTYVVNNCYVPYYFAHRD